MEQWEPYRPTGFLPYTEEHYAVVHSRLEPYIRARDYLRIGSTEYLDDCMRFLEERPRFHGSGYLTEDMLYFLSRPELTARECQRVVGAAEAIAREGYSREAWAAKKLLVRLQVPGWTAIHTREAARSAGD